MRPQVYASTPASRSSNISSTLFASARPRLRFIDSPTRRFTTLSCPLRILATSSGWDAITSATRASRALSTAAADAGAAVPFAGGDSAEGRDSRSSARVVANVWSDPVVAGLFEEEEEEEEDTKSARSVLASVPVMRRDVTASMSAPSSRAETGEVERV